MARRSLRARSAAAASYTCGGIGAPGGQLLHARVGDRREQHLMLGGQLRQHRHQALVERRCVQIGQQDHQRPPPDRAVAPRPPSPARRTPPAPVAAAPSRRPVGRAVRCATRCTRPARVTRSWAMKSTWSPARDASAANSSAASIDQSSRGQPPGSLAVGSTPTRPADVRPVSSTMTTRRSRSGRHVRTTTSAAPGGGAPVDGSDVVADDVLAQRVEFGALTADQHRCHAFELAQLRQPRGQVLA